MFNVWLLETVQVLLRKGAWPARTFLPTNTFLPAGAFLPTSTTSRVLLNHFSPTFSTSPHHGQPGFPSSTDFQILPQFTRPSIKLSKFCRTMQEIIQQSALNPTKPGKSNAIYNQQCRPLLPTMSLLPAASLLPTTSLFPRASTLSYSTLLVPTTSSD